MCRGLVDLGPPFFIVAYAGTDNSVRVLKYVSENMLFALSNISTEEFNCSHTISVCIHPWNHLKIIGYLKGHSSKLQRLHKDLISAQT